LTTRLALDPDPEFLERVDDTSNPSDSDSFVALMNRVDLIGEIIEKMNNLLVTESQLVNNDIQDLEEMDYSRPDFVRIIREASDILERVDFFCGYGLSRDAAIDRVGRQSIKRNAQQLGVFAKQIRGLASHVSRRERYARNISEIEFRLDMIYINNPGFFDAILTEFLFE